MTVPILTPPPKASAGPIILGIRPKPGADSSGPRVGRQRGRTIRLGHAVMWIGFLPPWTLEDVFGVTAYACGRCFRKLGDDPFGGVPGKLTPGAPADARCSFCGGRAERCDP